MTNNQIEFEESEHEVVYTSRKATRVIGLEFEEAGAKLLIFNPGCYAKAIKIKSKDLLKVLENPTKFRSVNWL